MVQDKEVNHNIVYLTHVVVVVLVAMATDLSLMGFTWPELWLQFQTPYNMMKPRTQTPPVVFLKTHKTGSSTVQNLLFRMGERDRATFAFPHHSYQFSYPEKYGAVILHSPYSQKVQHNMRLDVEQLKQVMPENAVYITILREPLRTFESVFSYYTSTVPSALSLFLESPDAFWDPKEPGNCLGRNPMSFDLGIDSQQWNTTWRTDLSLLEETFQLVMIAEHFDESLILLGSLLDLNMEELAYVRLNTRSLQDVTHLDDDTKDQISAWNTLDVLLYDFFLQIFLEKVEKYGLERLNSEVALLRATTNRIRRKCVARSGVYPEELEDLVRPWQTDTVTILGYQIQKNLTKPEQAFCTRLVLPELQYHAHLYFQVLHVPWKPTKNKECFGLPPMIPMQLCSVKSLCGEETSCQTL
uniref:Galactose-3-O-sulfotransferase 4 n=1 Tax=Labrus bergylta TaxID=56723 RepID=A0A3Q3FUB8_9LABR